MEKPKADTKTNIDQTVTPAKGGAQKTDSSAQGKSIRQQMSAAKEAVKAKGHRIKDRAKQILKGGKEADDNEGEEEDNESSEGSIHDDNTVDSTLTPTKSQPGQKVESKKEIRKASIPEEKKGSSSSESQMVTINRILATIFKKIVDTNNPVNSITSPLSLYFCFAMVAEGLTGGCQKEVSKAFGFRDEEVLDSSVIALLAYLRQLTTPDLTLKMDNSLFTNKNIKIKEGYAKSLKDKYNFTAESLDLGDPKSVKTINDRIVETTNGMIKQGVSLLSPSAFSVLVNTMYFNADWETSFDEGQTIPLEFKLPGGSTKIETDFMVNRSARAGILSSGEFDYLAINYKNTAIKFVIEMDKAGKLQSHPNADDVLKVAKKAQETLEIFIPKFTIQFSGDMIAALKELGVQKVFNASKDFSKISDHQMSISTILQNAFIQVDERGTEVALFTFAQEVGEIACINGSAKFVADHPFYYHIVDTQLGVILFSGTLTNPKV